MRDAFMRSSLLTFGGGVLPKAGCSKFWPRDLFYEGTDGQWSREGAPPAPSFISHLNGCFLSISAETGSSSFIATGGSGSGSGGRHGCLVHWLVGWMDR